MSRGVWYAVGAYLAWGLFPIYWKTLDQAPALELICHRIVWSCLTLYIVVAVRVRWGDIAAAFAKPKIVGIYLIASLLICVNWLVFVWGVNSGYLIETSLGYFINPLLSVLLGVVIFRERLRPLQWASIGLAAGAVLYLTCVYGAVPRIALALAFSFALYGMVKKAAPLSSLYGLTMETSLLLLPAAAYLIWQCAAGKAAVLHMQPVTVGLLLGSGLVTTLPLLLFTGAAPRIPLAQIGVLQYIAPTLQFLLGAVVYHERFTPARLGGFMLVWISLALFGVEGILHHRTAAIRRRVQPAPAD
jgi:chloramphenicol-sensitive protein RarD